MDNNLVTIEIPSSAVDWPEEYQILIGFIRKLSVDYNIDKDTCINLFMADVKMILDSEDKDMVKKLGSLENADVTWKIANLSRDHVGFWLTLNSHTWPKTHVEIRSIRGIAIWSYLLGVSNHNLISDQDRILHEIPKGYRHPLKQHLNKVFRYTNKKYV